MDVTYRIKQWNTNFENNRSREVKKTSWVAMPNRHDTLGFRTLLSFPDGPALYGTWCILVQVASRCSPRGTWTRDNGMPHTIQSLATKTGLSAALIQRCFEALTLPEIDWIERSQFATSAQEAATPPQEAATPPQEAATPPQEAATPPQEAATVRARAQDGGREGKEGRREKATGDRVAPSERFLEWMAGYRGRKAKPDQACQVWLSRISTPEDAAAAFACRDRYNASDEVSRTVLKEAHNFLREQADNRWAGQWAGPVKAQSPVRSISREYDPERDEVING